MNPMHEFPPKKILVPTDMSAASESALQYARYLKEHFGSGVLVLHANHFELPSYFSSGQWKDLKRELTKLGKAAKEHVRRQSEPILGFLPDIEIVGEAPTEAILEASRKNGTELIIMGMNHHRGLERFWMGSVTERVIRQSTVPVLAVRNAPAETPIRKIFCPMNPSETGKQALEYAAKISKAVQAHLTILHVVEPGAPPLTCPLVEEAIKNGCNVEEISLHGSAAKTIAEVTNDLKPDLVVMGAEHKSGILGELFSTTTSSIMQLAVGPLLIVPKKGDQKSGY
jgi:nucleotide-binding universal stress UspA family protein